MMPTDALLRGIQTAISRLQALVPFQFPNAPPAYFAPMGMGVTTRVTVAQGATLAVTHPLKRAPTIVWVLDNGTAPQTLLTVSARSTTSISISPISAGLTNALIWIV